ncbi:hypothetical protein FAIPA1_430002 [Frankia sp. AiPs1]
MAALRRTGRDVDDEVLAHIWPTHHENVHFYGTHTDGYRPLRCPGKIGTAVSADNDLVGRAHVDVPFPVDRPCGATAASTNVARRGSEGAVGHV